MPTTPQLQSQPGGPKRFNRKRFSRGSTSSQASRVLDEDDEEQKKAKLTTSQSNLHGAALMLRASATKCLANIKPYHECTFEEKLSHPLLDYIPLRSQLPHDPARSLQNVLHLTRCIRRLHENDLTFVIFHAPNDHLPGHWVKSLAQTLEHNAILRRIHLNGNRNINDADLEVLTNALQSNHTVVELAVGGMSLTDLGARNVSRMLQFNSTLMSLDLAGRKKLNCGRAEPPITDLGAQAIAEALQTNKSLTSLILSGHSISDRGAESLAGALETNHSLRHLVLCKNQIGDSGASAFATCLNKRKNGLVSLDLSGNHVGDIGVKGLCTSLQHNTCLTTLDLSQNKISNTGMAAILQLIMAHNQVLRHVAVFDKQSDEAKVRMIQEILNRRHPSDIRRYSTFPVRHVLEPYRDSDTNVLNLRVYPKDEPIKYYFGPKTRPRTYTSLPTPDKLRDEQPISFATRENYKMRMKQERIEIGKTPQSREWKLHKLTLKGQVSRKDWWPVHETWSEHKARLPLKYKEGIDCAHGFSYHPTESAITSFVEYRALTPSTVSRPGWLTVKPKPKTARPKGKVPKSNQDEVLNRAELLLSKDKNNDSAYLGKLLLGRGQVANRRRSTGTAPR